MRAGQMNKRVTLQIKSVTIDGLGTEVITWTDHATVWASVEPVTGREYYLAQQQATSISTKIGIRYRRGITGGWRVKYGNRIFDIQAPINVGEKNKELILLCEELQ